MAEKKTFYVCSNNGVTAVMTAEAYQRLQERQELIRETVKDGKPEPDLPMIYPVFTFADADHRSFKFMTGSWQLMSRLLDGHDVENGGIWVPFSNGAEWGWHGKERQVHELKYLTSLDQAIETFGLHS